MGASWLTQRRNSLLLSVELTEQGWEGGRVSYWYACLLRMCVCARERANVHRQRERWRESTQDRNSFWAHDSELHACLTTLVVCKRSRMTKRVHVTAAKCASDSAASPAWFPSNNGVISQKWPQRPIPGKRSAHTRTQKEWLFTSYTRRT